MPNHLLLYLALFLACGTLAVAIPRLTRIPGLVASAVSAVVFAGLTAIKKDRGQKDLPWSRAAKLTYGLSDAFTNRRWHETAVRKIWLYREEPDAWIASRCGYSVQMVRKIKDIFREGEPGDDYGASGVAAVLPRPPQGRGGSEAWPTD